MPVLKIWYLATIAFQFFGCVKSIISMPLPNQTLGIFTVNRFALALAVRRIMSASNRAFVRSQSAPLKALQNVFFSAFYITALIGILNAKNKITLMFFGEKIIEQHSTYATQVQASGGAWRKSYSYFFI